MIKLSSLMLLALTACSRDAAVYPSLGARPVEQLGFAEPTLDGPPPAVVDPALDAQIAKVSAELSRVARGFAGDAATAERAATAARRAAVGSEPWLDAQVALAELDDWRAQASALAVEAEQLAATRAATLQPIYPPLTALREATAAEAQGQAARIDRIQATLRPV